LPVLQDFQEPGIEYYYRKFSKTGNQMSLDSVKIFQDPGPEVIKINEQPKEFFVQFCGFKSLKNISKRFQNGHSYNPPKKKCRTQPG
jgi:hypothetical protein